MPKLHQLVPHQRRKEFQSFIFSWWRRHKRDLPWRHTHNPYKIFISEIMLQQTQVSRVIPKYVEFTRAYPKVKSLEKASTSEVLRIWRGMGYNRRALYLKKAASAIVQDYKGEFPKSEKELIRLPGVGTYTARAILVFAYRENIALIDTNIRKIITHFFFNDKPQKEKMIEEIADQLVPKGKSWEWHQALMDFGALALQSRAKPRDLSKKTIPFKGSNRFYRGRIIDLLREGSVKEQVLLKGFSASIIHSLMRDGLIEREKGMLRLPQ